MKDLVRRSFMHESPTCNALSPDLRDDALVVGVVESRLYIVQETLLCRDTGRLGM